MRTMLQQGCPADSADYGERGGRRLGGGWELCSAISAPAAWAAWPLTSAPAPPHPPPTPPPPHPHPHHPHQTGAPPWSWHASKGMPVWLTCWSPRALTSTCRMRWGRAPCWRPASTGTTASWPSCARCTGRGGAGRGGRDRPGGEESIRPSHPCFAHQPHPSRGPRPLVPQAGASLDGHKSSVEQAAVLCTAVFDGNLPLLRRLIQSGVHVDAGDYGAPGLRLPCRALGVCFGLAYA